MRHKILALALIFSLTFLISVLASGQSFAGTPTEEVRAVAIEVQRILDDPVISKEDKRRLLEKALIPHFDFIEMSKRVLGTHLAKNRERLPEFIPLFIKLLSNAYLNFSTIDEARGAKISYLYERVSGEYAEVGTKIITTKQEIQVSYRLRRSDKEWKIYDILVEGISLVSSYRSQFNEIIIESSFDELLKKMRDKVEKKEDRRQ